MSTRALSTIATSISFSASLGTMLRSRWSSMMPLVLRLRGWSALAALSRKEPLREERKERASGRAQCDGWQNLNRAFPSFLFLCSLFPSAHGLSYDFLER